MAEFILQTDPLEFQNTRQSTKIAFLQQEVQQLQDHIQDLEQVVRINKEALKIASLQQGQNPTKQKAGNHNDTTASTIENGLSQAQYKNTQLLAEHLQEENMKLLEIIDKIKKERNIAQSKALISEQICEEAQRHEIEAVSELEEKIYDLRKLLQDKEYTIQELEKLKLIPEQEGVLIKKVLNPTEQGLKLHNEIDSLNGMLAKVSKELNKIRAEKQELMAINFSLSSELMKIRATLNTPLNHPFKLPNFGNEIDLNHSAGNAASLFQPPGIDFDDDNSDCPSPLPDKVSYPEIKHGKAPVPKLDLSQAKKIQENLANKLNQAAAAQNHHAQVDPKAIEKIKRLETQNELIKKRLSHEMINNRLLSDQMAQLQRERTQLHATNEILIKSNKRYEEKAQKIYYTLEFYKDFYHKYIDLITRGHATHMKTSSTYLPNFDKLKLMNERINSDIDASPDQFVKDLKRSHHEEGKEVNVSVLEAQEEEEDKQNEILKEKSGNNVFEFTREQSKFFLLNLAKDLYVNTNIHKSTIAKNILRKLEFGRNNPEVKPTIRLKRSVSNPLDYVSERRKLIFEPRVHNKEKKPTKLKREKEVARLADDQGLLSNGNKQVIAGVRGQESAREVETPLRKEIPYFGAGPDEMISFTVDADEFNKQKVMDVSFISNNEILDQIKNT